MSFLSRLFGGPPDIDKLKAELRDFVDETTPLLDEDVEVVVVVEVEVLVGHVAATGNPGDAGAEALGEVPVGAMIVLDGRIVATGHNRVIADNDPSAHAEIVALRDAGRALGNYRLPGTTLFVTLEPCAMCVGAMIHARIARIVFAASDPKTGALGGAFDLPGEHAHNHVIRVQGGLLAAEAGAIGPNARPSTGLAGRGPRAGPWGRG